MKKILFLIGLSLITLQGYATVRDTIPYNKGLSSYGYVIHRIIVDSVLVPPRIDTTSGSDTVRVGSLVFRTTGGDHTLYIRYPDKWERIGTASVQVLSKNPSGDSIYLSGGGGVVFDRDTQQLSIITGSIAGDTLKLTRSIPVFLPYLDRSKFIDSLNDNRQALGYDEATNKLWLIPGDTVQLKNAGVFSVNGKTGIVTLTTDSVPEGDINLYFTQTRARTSVSGSSSIGYNSSTGIFSAKISSDSGNTLVVNSDGLYVPGGEYANKDSVYTKSASDARYLRTIGGVVTGPINYSSTPVASSELVNKAYVDALASGLSWKDAVVAATTANITLSGLQGIDGVSVSAGQRVLVKDQTDSTQNGVYVAATGAWTRSTDATTGTQIKGMAVYVDAGGVTNGGTQWVNANTSAITVGSTGVFYTQFGATSVTVPTITQVLSAGDSTSHRIKVGDATATSLTVSGLGNAPFLKTDGNGMVQQGSALPQVNVAGLPDSLLSKVNTKDSGKVYMTPSEVHANTADSLTNYVNVSHTQTITGAKTFNKNVTVDGQVDINGSGNNGVITTGGYTFVGERYGLGGLTLTSNAYPTENADVWNQKQTNITSKLIYLGISDGRLYEYSAPSGQSSGSFNSFWGTAPADTFARYSDMRSYVSSNPPTLQQVTTEGDSTTSGATFDSDGAPISIGSGSIGIDINLNHRIGGWAKGISVSQPSTTELTLNRGMQMGLLGSDSLATYSFWLVTNDSLTNAYQGNSGIRLYPDGSLYYGTPPANSSPATKFLGLSSDGHTISTRTASQVLSDIGAASSTNVALLSSDNTFTGANSFAEVPRITSSTPGHNAIYFSDASGGTGSSPTYNVIGFNGTSFYFTPANKLNSAQFSATGLTARRTYTLPDVSDTLATSDMVAAVVGDTAAKYVPKSDSVDGGYVPYSQSTLQAVTDRGATTTNSISCGSVGIGTALTANFSQTSFARSASFFSSGAGEGAGALLGGLRFTWATGNNAEIQMFRGDNATDGAGLSFLTSSNTSGAIERMRIGRNGNVGIGTTSPQDLLDVNGNVRTHMVSIYEDSNKIGFLSRASYITSGWNSIAPNALAITCASRDFAVGGWRKSDGVWGGDWLYINSDNGNVGINTTSPGAKLDVEGTAFFSGITGFGGTASSPYATINGLGQVSAQTLSTVSDATIGGNVTTTEYRVSDLNTAPSSSTDTGTKGEIRITAGYIYVCIATNTWVRAALSTW